MKQQTLERVKERLALIDRMRAGGESMQPQFSEADVLDLIKEIERGQRMLLAACCDMGAIGEALGADMDDDGDVMLGLASDLKKDAERYRWLRDGDYLHGWVSVHPCDEDKRFELTDKAIDFAMMT